MKTKRPLTGQYSCAITASPLNSLVSEDDKYKVFIFYGLIAVAEGEKEKEEEKKR